MLRRLQFAVMLIANVKATTDINKVGLLISYTNKGENKNVLQNPLIILKYIKNIVMNLG